MLQSIQIIGELERERKRLLNLDGKIIEQANRVLKNNLFSQKNVLENLKLYNQSFELIHENTVEREKIFGLDEIKTICINFNLRFLDIKKFKGQIPSEIGRAHV